MALSPQNAHNTSTINQFVPEFLTGPTRNTPNRFNPGLYGQQPQSNFHASSPWQHPSSGFNTPSSPFSPHPSLQSLNTHSFPNLHRDYPDELAPINNNATPPVLDLYSESSNESMSFVNPQISKVMMNEPILSVHKNENRNASQFDSFNKVLTPTNPSAFMSPGQLDPFYSQGEAILSDSDLNENWVTVFGFQPGSANYILQQFSNYGTILSHKMNKKGNWMHIQYQCKLQAKTALSKSGKIFSDEIMLGVTQCIDTKTMEEAKENRNQLSTPSSMYSAASPRATARPLAQAYKASTLDRSVIRDANRPQQNKNVVSKAMEYFFNW